MERLVSVTACVTQPMNEIRVPGWVSCSLSTVSLIALSVSSLTAGPAPQTIRSAGFSSRNERAGSRHASVGSPSVKRNAKGRQSPLWVSEALRTSSLIHSLSKAIASPREVAPYGSSWGDSNSAMSMSGTICSAVLSKVMTLNQTDSIAMGSPMSELTKACRPVCIASIGSPAIDPEQSSSR